MEAELPDVSMRPREKFPQNLRLLRISRGFARARHFAEAIGIGENRYTRYERGEAEPNIDLIYKICDVLKAAPNDLFGIGDEEPAYRAQFKGDAPQRVGFSELPQVATPMPSQLQSPSQERQAAGWALARRLAQLDAQAPNASATEQLKATAAIFLELEKSPFQVIAQILSGPAATSASADAMRDVNELVDDYLARIG